MIPESQRGDCSEGPPADTLTVERLVPGGRGFSRDSQGKPVFVRGGLPGDSIVPSILRDKRSFVEVDEFRLVKQGPQRVPARCVDEAKCGGCDIMKLSAVGQAEAKIGMLLEALQRTGGFVSLTHEDIALRSVGAKFDYRLRIRLQVRNGRIGFFSSASHELVEVQRCEVASPPLRQLLNEVRQCIRTDSAAFDSVEAIELRALPEGSIASTPKERDSAYIGLKKGFRSSAALRAALRCLEHRCLVAFSDQRELAPVQKLWVTDDVHVLVPVGGFCQVHPEVNRALIAEVLLLAQEAGARRFLDLYCGSGNFSLPLGKLGLSGVGVELSREAIAAAWSGARAQGLDQLRFFTDDVGKHANGLVPAGQRFDLVIVDPPRAGARDICAVLPCLTRGKLILISCDPVTLARDLRCLVDRGARLESIQAWDMFPQTHHLETLVVLNCADSGAC